VYRLAEQPDAPLGLTETEFAARSTLIGSVPFDSPQVSGRTLTYNDTLELAGQPSRLRYAVRYVNAANQRAGFSNFLLIEPAARVANPPQGLRDQESETAITLNWSPPDSNIDGSSPVNLLGYNLYRTTSGDPTPTARPLNSSLIQGNSFVDRAFQFGDEYTYVVRSVSLGTNGGQVESLNSDGLTVQPKDIYPPAAPNPVTIAPAPGRLSIFFPAGTEPDIAGYNIYRSEDPNQPLDRWTKLNSSPLSKTTYQDEAIQSGKRYYYYVTALDTNGNVSQPSETVSEVAP
jgi:hypothetical protein